MSYEKFIEIVPGKRGGKPCIKNTRITVYDVLEWLANGMSASEITADFPELNQDQIQACLKYAAAREHNSLTIKVA